MFKGKYPCNYAIYGRHLLVSSSLTLVNPASKSGPHLRPGEPGRIFRSHQANPHRVRYVQLLQEGPGCVELHAVIDWKRREKED